MTLRAHPHRDHQRTTAVVAALGATALVLTGCSSDDGEAETTSTPAELTTIAASPETQSAPSTSQAAETSAAEAPADDSPDAAAFAKAGTADKEHMPARMDSLNIVDTRVGEHDGYDRVVFEFDGDGDGDPGYHTAYSKEPAQQGSGFPVEYPGNVALVVMIHGVKMNLEGPPPGPVAGAAGNIAGVKDTGTFEADAQYVIGLDRERPYTVTTLQNPTRLVIDFQS
ncbi:AMIN-like domain-containing (lipo)protein [Corynebacterium frankenforstense]